MESQDYQGFKGFFHTLFPSSIYKIETYLEGQWEREVIRRIDKTDPTQIEVLYLPENGLYSQLLQLRIKHPQSPGLSRLQNSFFISPITLGSGYFNQQQTTAIEQALGVILRKGWQEMLFSKEEKQLHIRLFAIDFLCISSNLPDRYPQKQNKENLPL